MAMSQDEIAAVLRGIESKRTGLDTVRPPFQGRMLEIAMHSVRGMSNAEIARRLNLDPHTVAGYVNGEAFQLMLEEVREKAVDQQSDLTTRLREEADQNITTLVAIRDDIEASPDTRRRSAMDMLGLLRDPPAGKENVKQTIRVFLNPPTSEPKVIEGAVEEAQARVVPLRRCEEAK